MGSREGVDPDAVKRLIDRFNPVTTVVISGGARGVDTVAAEHARSRGIRVVEIRPNYKKHGNSATQRRNKEIVLAADDVAAFWNGMSGGTMNTCKHAHKLGRPLALFDGMGNLLMSYEGGNPRDPKNLPTMAIPKTGKLRRVK